MLFNAGQLVTCDDASGRGGEGLGMIEDGALLCAGGRIVWTGTTRELERKHLGRVARRIDAKGALVTPGFVDPHTHLLFAGSREDELERKVRGESYKQILAGGGGILRTIRETRKATPAQVAKESMRRLRQLLSSGVTTVEVKTGYGGDAKSEAALVNAMSMLKKNSPIELITTLLGLHATPPEFKTSEEYVKYTVRETLPRIARMRERPRFSDCFCEEGVFTAGQCKEYLRASKELGFELKVHADEFSDSGGAGLAAESGCVSADHLGKSNPEGIDEMGKKGVAAVLLPGTSLCSGIPYARAKRFIESGCEVALGTDLSPNSWVESPQLVMSLACLGNGMTPKEALLGFTSGAARALGRSDVGRLAPGSSADLVIHNVPNYQSLPYRLGGRYVDSVYKSGRLVYRS